MILPGAQLENALSMARTQGLFSGSFDDLVHFLKAEVDEMTLRCTQVRANRTRTEDAQSYLESSTAEGSIAVITQQTSTTDSLRHSVI